MTAGAQLPLVLDGGPATVVRWAPTFWCEHGPDATDAEKVAAVLALLAEHPLEPGLASLGYRTDEGLTRFHGNFYTVSGCFCIDTRDAALVAQMNTAIRRNLATPAYRAAKAERDAQDAARRAREARRAA